MLPVTNLDNENFYDIFEEARKMISRIYPEWTDYNEHDPGITFLELFSWLKEMQQYHLNQIGEDNLLMYLKLLGMRQSKKETARALVTFTDVEQDVQLPKGSKLFAGDTCFETCVQESLESIAITKCVSKCKSRTASVEEGVLHSGSFMRFYIFGEYPEKNDEFLIEFNQPYETGKIHSLYFKIFDEYPVKRNKITEESFIPLAKLSMEYCHDGVWKSCDVVKDETFQFIQSGKLYFTVGDEMQKNQGGYWLRFRITDCNYDIPPVLQEITTNVVEAVQKDTLSEYEDFTIEKNDDNEYRINMTSYLAQNGIQEIYIREEHGFRRFYDFNIEKEEDRVIVYLANLFTDGRKDEITVRVVNFSADFAFRRSYETNGFPYQKLELEDGEILGDDLEIFVENELYGGFYEQWERTDDFFDSTEEDRHYVFDDENGIIYFGDCENGRAPEGSLVIIGCSDSAGVRGNVKARRINQVAGGLDKLKVINKDNASGGSDKETVEACFRRFMKEFRQVKRAVTNEDYEQLVRKTPGLMIQNVKAIPVSLMKKQDGSLDETCMTLVVKQYTGGKQAQLCRAYLDNIDQMLDKKRLVGTRISILSPEYMGISIFGEITVKPHYLNAKELVREAVERYFEEAGSIFGKPVLYNEIYGIIDVLDCVSQVQNLSINSLGRGITRTMNGDLMLPVNGLAYLKDADYFITSTE